MLLADARRSARPNDGVKPGKKQPQRKLSSPEIRQLVQRYVAGETAYLRAGMESLEIRWSGISRRLASVAAATVGLRQPGSGRLCRRFFWANCPSQLPRSAL